MQVTLVASCHWDIYKWNQWPTLLCALTSVVAYSWVRWYRWSSRARILILLVSKVNCWQSSHSSIHFCFLDLGTLCEEHRQRFPARFLFKSAKREEDALSWLHWHQLHDHCLVTHRSSYFLTLSSWWQETQSRGFGAVIRFSSGAFDWTVCRCMKGVRFIDNVVRLVWINQKQVHRITQHSILETVPISLYHEFTASLSWCILDKNFSCICYRKQ